MLLCMADGLIVGVYGPRAFFFQMGYAVVMDIVWYMLIFNVS